MKISSAALLGLVAPSQALIRFYCSQLVVERLDPLVNPGLNPSPHLHQIIGGNAFNATMPPSTVMSNASTCTTCQMADDFSNYWTAVLFFKHKNDSYHRVPQVPNVGFDGANGGMTVYYMQNGLADYAQKSKVTAFKPGFRMLIGDAQAHTRDDVKRFRQLTYTCLQTLSTRWPETVDFPTDACPAGIMVNLRFPTCWDGKTLDSDDHMSHMAYPESGTFESNGPCPATHPVPVPQLMYETIFDTSKFNDKSTWPEDGQPFVWSMADSTGFANHGDYVFGWKDDSLQKIMDEECYVNCKSARQQSIAAGNKCSQNVVVSENVDGWLESLPGRTGDDLMPGMVEK